MMPGSLSCTLLPFEPALDVVGVVDLHFDLDKINRIRNLHHHGIERRAVRLGVFGEIGKIIAEALGVFLGESRRELRRHIFVTDDLTFFVIGSHIG